jgi:CHAD domain-containing protein
MDETDETTTASEIPAVPEAVAPPSEVEPVDAWKKVRKLAIRQLDRFMSLEPRVLRGDDPDAIHDLRVASRRLQQIVDLLHPKPRPAEVRRLRRKIQRCRRALGEVRNCDVQLLRVEKTLASKRTASRESWEAVRHYLRQRRAENFDKAVRKLGKVNLAVFYVQLKEHLVPHPGRGEPVEGLRSEKFYERVGEALARVWHGMEAQVAQSHRDANAAVIHKVRIAAKRVRYLIEVIRAFQVPGAARTLARLRALQRLLGDWHDLEVLEQMMIEMVARPEFLRDHLSLAMGVERLILRNRAHKQGYRQKYARATTDSGDYQQIKEWVAGILASPAAAFRIAD